MHLYHVRGYNIVFSLTTTLNVLNESVPVNTQTILKIRRGNVEINIDGHILEQSHLKKIGLNLTNEELLHLQYSINLQYQKHILNTDLDIRDIKETDSKEYHFCDDNLYEFD